MTLPASIKRRLRSREDGRDVVGITVSWQTVKKVWAWIKKRRG